MGLPRGYRGGLIEGKYYLKSTMQDSKLSVTALFAHGALLYPDSKVITFDGAQGVTKTYSEIANRAGQLANALVALGITTDDRVATFCFNHNVHLEAYLAVPSMGAILHTLNVRLFADQLQYIINDASDKVIIVDSVVLGLLIKVLKGCKSVRHVLVVGDFDPGVFGEIAAGGVSYEETIAKFAPAFPWIEPDFETDAAALCYTSGTTGNPKGVAYSHRSTWLHSLVASSSATLAVSTADRALLVVPMFHANAWGIPYAAWMVGADMVMPSRFLQAQPLGAMIENLSPTIAVGVPTIWNDLMRYIDQNPVDFSSLRLVTSGGSAVPRSLIEAFRDKAHVALIQGWGMTETSPVCTLGIPPRGVDAQLDIEYRVTAGRPVIGVSIRIVDAQGNVVANDGKTMGEIQVSGPWVTGSYFKDPLPENFDRGWLRTGDMGTLDSECYLRVVDRSKDVIKSGGEWISSVELENAIMAHPLVYEAAVVGVPDVKWDERPLACVVIKPGSFLTASELSEFLFDKVAKWWLPERWSFVDEIPKTSVGKFDKKVLRNLYAEEKLVVIRVP